MPYRTVFEMTWAAYPWPLLLLSTAGLVVGTAILWTRESRESISWTWLGWGLAVLSGLATGWLLWVLAGHSATLRDLAANQLTITEGLVEHYAFAMHDGHGFESFMVSGTRFHYSDFLTTGGYNTPASRGGIIREGLRVRITHRGNTIAKLDVAAP